MVKEPRSAALHAYDQVIARVREIYHLKHGHRHGAVTWFAELLGVSRQTVDNWGKRVGIPRQYVARVAKITGFTGYFVRPDSIMVEIPVDVWDEITDAISDVEDRVTIFPTEKSWQKARRKQRKSGVAAE